METTETETEKRKYELTLLISADLSQQELEDFLKTIESLISKNSHVLTSQEPKKIILQYQIAKKKSAYLLSLEIRSDPADIKALTKELEKENNIIRFLIIKKDEKAKKQTGRVKDIAQRTKDKPKVELEKISEKLKDL